MHSQRRLCILSTLLSTTAHWRRCGRTGRGEGKLPLGRMVFLGYNVVVSVVCVGAKQRPQKKFFLASCSILYVALFLHWEGGGGKELKKNICAHILGCLYQYNQDFQGTKSRVCYHTIVQVATKKKNPRFSGDTEGRVFVQPLTTKHRI